MCGRFAQTQTGTSVAEAFELASPPDVNPRYNIAPSQLVSVVTQSRQSGDRVHHFKRWGLVPGWSQDASIGHRLINARSETVAQKPAFRNAFQKRRCLIVADGFYEWQKTRGDSTKQPYLIQLKSRTLFAFAGLWERWKDSETDETIFSCTILTTAANPVIEPIHHRMPVILSPQDYDHWLDPSYYNPGSLESLLVTGSSEQLDAVAITSAVNNPRNETPAVQQPLEEN